MAFEINGGQPTGDAAAAPERGPSAPRHPGLSAALNRLGRGEDLSAGDIGRLERQLARLTGGSHPSPEQIDHDIVERVATATPDRLLPGSASAGGTARFAARRGADAPAFYRAAQQLFVSSIGIGTYRGAMDAETDAAYADAVEAALRGGINLIDTSLNYRLQRSEQSVAAAISRFIGEASGRRDEIVVCTKGGFLVPGAITPGTLAAADVVGGIHSLAPAFLADQIERSRRNLGLETIDIYYLHNPETQLGFVGAAEFRNRMRAAFEQLEQAVAERRILYYGTATWDGYWDGTLSLPSLVELAREVAGDGHHFRFVQLPFHLGCGDVLAGGGSGVLDAAAELGIGVIASASIWQARLSEDLPEEIVQAMPGLDSDAQRALQFTRSAPAIVSALVGMRDTAHVADNLGVARIAPLDPAQFRSLCAAIA